MHQPRPYGLHGDIRSEEDAAAVESLVRRLTNIKSTGKLDGLKLVRALPGGGVAIATDMGGVLRVIVQNPVQSEPQAPEFDGRAGMRIPMLFSGVVRQAVLQAGAGLVMDLTSMAQRRLAQYKPGSNGQAPVSQRQRLQRFAIEYAEWHAELKPKGETSALFTQYAALRPSWFSGSMATVVQVVGGYGRQDLEALPKGAMERIEMVLPAKVADRVRLQLGNVMLPCYTGSPPEKGQIQYDYKFQETHGVCIGGDGKPWLVQLNTQGAYAMPLPLVPATTTPAFREYVEEVGDAELQWLLERFGGMPSGESFPRGPKAFEAWRRAGAIVKLGELREFYDCLAYSSACGWAFNKRGSEAFNTCYEFGDDGLQRGHAYKLRLSMGALPDGGKLPTDFHVDDPEDARALNAYLSALYRQLSNRPEHLAIKYKLRRVGASAVLARARGAMGSNSPVPGEIDYWDNLEAPPLSGGSASLVRSGSGIVWAGGSPRSHPQIKFPEPWMDGCISHDFGRLEGSPPPSTPPRCDTIMYGYYVGDDLKVVKYFLDDRGFVQEVEDNFEECMTVGSWTSTQTTGSSSLLGRFYTTDIDERKAAAETTTVTTIVGTDLGYDSQPHFAFDYIFATSGGIWRNRYFQHKTNSSTTGGYGMTVAVCVPFLERSAVFHAKRETTTGGSKSESVSLGAVRDPNSYRMNTYDFVWAWSGTPFDGNMYTAKGVNPSPKDGNPIWVRGYNYNPGGCSDFADQGDWMGSLPQDYTWLVHPNRHIWQHSGGGGAPKIKTYNITEGSKSTNDGELLISIVEQPRRVNKDPRTGYFVMSPDEAGNVFYVDAIHNAAGEAAYANCDEADAEAPKQRWRTGYTRLADHQSAHHFLGVINE
ncbi:hypothetical protein A4F85_04595 [Delftia sp. GW456-R20]|uniref:hypothetical protein n=1 Tax=Delftia sp. GW456-R20 TaxID=1827145 RepID=UPI0007AE5E6E|nr:hypothetical protein [Delftia sp. GW456-R20]KZK32000.1 hypothetical protein A4F85_04595 [Delftia sp. GW456-R20]